MREASDSIRAACAVVRLLSDCARALLPSAFSDPHAALVLSRASADWADCVVADRLLPGPSPATNEASASSCAAAPATWTLKLARPWLPCASRALHVTTVSPIAKVE